MSVEQAELLEAIALQAHDEFERQKDVDMVEATIRHVAEDGTRTDEDIIYLEFPE